MTRHDDTFRRRHRLAAGAIAALLLASSPLLAQSDAPAPEAPAALTDLAGDDLNAAVADILDRGDASRLATLSHAIRRDAPKGVRAMVAEIGVERPITSEHIIDALVESLPVTEGAPLVTTVRAIGGASGPARSRRVVRAMIRFLRQDPRAAGREDVRAAGFDALKRLTGRNDLGRDLSAWDEWWTTVEWLPESVWQMQYAEAQASRVRRLEAELDRLGVRIETVYGRLHARLNDDERADLMVDLLRDDLPRVRAYGFRLAFRALLNAQPLKDEVIDVVIERLDDPAPSLRAQAATLLEKRSRPGLSERVAGLLAVETEPDAAAAMLRLLANQPHPDATPAILHWLAVEGPPHEAAAAAALALLRDGGLQDDAARARIRELTLAGVGRRPSPASIRMLGLLSEWDVVAPFLEHEDSALAVAAAESLLSDGRQIDAIIDAAREKSALFDVALRTLRAHRADASGFRTAQSLPSPATTDRDAAIAAFAAELSPDELLRLVEATPEPASVIEIVTPMAERPLNADAVDASTQLDLFVRLIGAHLAMKRPDEAMKVLDRVSAEFDAPELPRYRVFCLIWLNRIDEAQAITKQAEIGAVIWLDALEAAAEEQHAAAVADVIDALYAERLTDAERARLQRLRERFTEAEPDVESDAEDAPG